MRYKNYINAFLYVIDFLEGEGVVKTLMKQSKITRITIYATITIVFVIISLIIKSYFEYRQTQDVPITIGEIDYTYSIKTTGSWDQQFFLELEINDEVSSYVYYLDVFGFDGYEVEVVEVYTTSEAKYYEILFKVKSSDIDDNELWWISRTRHFIEEKNGTHNFIDKTELVIEYDFLEDILNDEDHILNLRSNFTKYEDWISPNYKD